MKKRVLFVVGTKPEAIKTAPVLLELYRRDVIDAQLCLSGQHREMVHDVLREFGIGANYDLDIMRDGQSLFDITSGVLCGLDNVLDKCRPAEVVVHGDTTTAFTAALAAFYKKIPIAHIEAGLRTDRLDSPYPEEFNRRAVDLLSTIDFTITETARSRLIKEGKSPERVFCVGSTAIDAVRLSLAAHTHAPLPCESEGRRLIILTVHRRENDESARRGIMRAVRRAVEEREDTLLLCPMHPAPNDQRITREELSGNARIILTPPFGVTEFHRIMSRAHLIVTDSGGIEEEAPALGIPTIVVREATERPEGLEDGVMTLAGTREEDIYRELCHLLDDTGAYTAAARPIHCFGNGHAARRIADIMEAELT